MLDVISGCVAAGTASIAGLLLLLQVSSLNRVALIARWTPSPIQGWDRKVACVGEPVQRTVRNVAGHLPAIGRKFPHVGWRRRSGGPSRSARPQPADRVVTRMEGEGGACHLRQALACRCPPG